MNDNDTIYSDVLDYFTAEFDALEERLKTGTLDDFKERVLMSRKISQAVGLLSPYVRSDPRARQLVRNAEALKKSLLSVREIFARQLAEKDQQSLLQSVVGRKALTREESH